LAEVLKEEDLVGLRDAFRELEQAVAISDLASVESATMRLRDLMDRVGASNAVLESDRSLLRDLDSTSGDVSALLDSRLRAFKLAIAAWQGPAPGRLK
jgi:hypothetical protein